jgi:acetyl esterase/lipase
MDNSQFGTGPSQEWRAYSKAHPELAIDEDGRDNDTSLPEVLALRDTVNAGRDASSRDLFQRGALGSRVSIHDHVIPTSDGSTITMRSYRPTGLDPHEPVAAYLYYHGGGMLFGTLDSEEFVCATWAHRLGLVVLNVCYRHTPDFVFPTQHNDAWDAFEWVMANAQLLAVDSAKIVVGGISAGGSLTASVLYREAQLAREAGRPVRIKGQLLVIPWLIHRDAYPFHLFAAPQKSSLVQCATAPILPKDRYDLFTDLLKIQDPREPWMNVGLASEEELKGTPRTAFIVNGWDLLRDEGFLHAAKLERMGVPVKKHVFPGMPHAFRRQGDLPSSKKWDEVMLDCIQWCLDDTREQGHGTSSWIAETVNE